MIEQQHCYEIGQHVTLTSGEDATIVYQWHEADGTPGYSVRLDTPATFKGYTINHTGIHECHIRKAGDAA